jgi:tRNA threonylcarbamoyl adenosine modification protein (Sua5/YciO/YrdC/YwlC family)
MPKQFKSLDDPELARLLKAGNIGVLPTDTVYGLVARAADPVAVERLYAAKQRESKPGTLIAASIDQLVELGIKRRYLTAVEKYWPGRVSIEIPHTIAYLSRDTGHSAFRIVDNPALVALLNEVGPLETTSANLPGEPVANTIAEAQAYFGDYVDFYMDGGDLSERKSSTVIRMVDDAVEVIRPGAVTINEETGEIVHDV